jgi:hypothetical protein
MHGVHEVAGSSPVIPTIHQQTGKTYSFLENEQFPLSEGASLNRVEGSPLIQICWDSIVIWTPSSGFKLL